MNNQKVTEYLNKVTEQIRFREAHDSVRQELRSHIEDHIQAAQSYGLTEDRAIDESLRRMGEADTIGSSLNDIHQSKVELPLVGLTFLLCVTGLGILSSSQWIGLQMIWFAIGISISILVYLLPYKRLMNVSASLYPIAVAGLVAAQFSGISFDGQPYLSLFGLKLKIIDLSACLMALALPAIGELFQSKKNLIPILILVPVFYFSSINSAFPAAVLLIGGIAGLSQSKIPHWIMITTGAIGALLISGLSKMPFLNTENLSAVVQSAAHTDFILSAFAQNYSFASIVLVTVLTVFISHLILRMGLIKTAWLKATVLTCCAVFGIEITFGLSSNYGFTPMFKTGINLPFLSYGGSLMVAHLLMVGMVLACLKRKTVCYR